MRRRRGDLRKIGHMFCTRCNVGKSRQRWRRQFHATIEKNACMSSSNRTRVECGCQSMMASTQTDFRVAQRRCLKRLFAPWECL